jgi:hypothetical protein
MVVLVAYSPATASTLLIRSGNLFMVNKPVSYQLIEFFVPTLLNTCSDWQVTFAVMFQLSSMPHFKICFAFTLLLVM